MSLTFLLQAVTALAAQMGGVNLDGNVSNVFASTPIFAVPTRRGSARRLRLMQP